MDVVPVIDVSCGRCVQAVAGNRSAYKPLVSSFVAGQRPDDVGAALISQFAPRSLYVADLDGITRNAVQWACIESLAELPCTIWWDAGVRRTNWKELAAFASSHTNVHCILATETMDSPDLIGNMLDQLGTDRVLVSLDLRHGKLVTEDADGAQLGAEQLMRQFAMAGASRFIVLDISAVGTSSGCPTVSLVDAIKRAHPHLMIATGGGIRSSADLARLADAGCDAALVGSGIHLGRIEVSNWPPG